MNPPKIKLLIISPFVPYDNVPHAGGKIHNFNVKSFLQSGLFDVTLLSTGAQNEEALFTLHTSGIKTIITFLHFPHNAIRRIMTKVYSIIPFCHWGIISFPYFRRPLLKSLHTLKKEKFKPDVIVIEWTQVGYLLESIKNTFKGVPIGILIHDVIYQSMRRSYLYEKNLLKKLIMKSQLKSQKTMELKIYKNTDFLISINGKDKQLIVSDGINSEKVTEVIPFYETKTDVIPDLKSHNLLYYGSMRRPENYQSAIELISDILPLVLLRYPDTHLYIVGDCPPDNLKRAAGENITVTGFVEDPTIYFSKCSCLVAPLVIGAGIKIKVLEAMSAGLVVITNDCGIEGIPALNEHDFLLANSQQEFASQICKVFRDTSKAVVLGNNAKKFIENEFSSKKGFETYCTLLKNIVTWNQKVN